MLDINWGAYVLVAVVSFAAAVLVVMFYALSLRLLATGTADDTESDGSVTSAAKAHRPVAATVGGYACLTISAAAVLYGLYLIIPQFH